MYVVVYCLWAVWWYFVCDAAVSTVTGLWTEWPDLWFLAGAEIFLCEVCFLWWWPWRLLSCVMVTPCSLLMCEYSMSLLLCLLVQQLYCTESQHMMSHPVAAVVLMAVFKDPLWLSGDNIPQEMFLFTATLRLTLWLSDFCHKHGGNSFLKQIENLL